MSYHHSYINRGCVRVRVEHLKHAEEPFLLDAQAELLDMPAAGNQKKPPSVIIPTRVV
jgi:hypothetical protein